MNTIKSKLIIVFLFTSFSFLVNLNSYASTYGSFTDYRTTFNCDPNFDEFCEEVVDEAQAQKNKAEYRQDLSASDSFLANCKKKILFFYNNSNPLAVKTHDIRACESVLENNASMAAANTAYNNGNYRKAFDIFRSLSGSKHTFKVVAESDVVFEPFYDAAQGDAIAQERLGQMYYEGKGVAQDYNEAVYWYSKSYNHGYVTAREYERILLRGRVKGFNPNNF